MGNITLHELRTSVLYRLGVDGSGAKGLWTGAEIDRHLREALKMLCFQTGILWRRTAIPDEAGVATYDLPQDLYSIERVTWDGYTIDPLTPREAEAQDRNYRSNRGTVTNYMVDTDGMHVLRKVKIPDINSPSANSNTGTWGILVFVENDPEVVWGFPVQIPGFDFTGDQWGLPRFVSDGTNLMVVEYTHRPRPLLVGTDAIVDLPNRYAKHLRHFALSQAYNRTGPGQNLKLAKHYEARWVEAIDRIRRHVRHHVNAYRTGVMGSFATSGNTRPARPVLPSNFPATRFYR